MLLDLLYGLTWTAILIRVYAWMGILSNNGLINSTLMWLGLTSEPIQLLRDAGFTEARKLPPLDLLIPTKGAGPIVGKRFAVKVFVPESQAGAVVAAGAAGGATGGARPRRSAASGGAGAGGAEL